eukprot:1162905-Amphidinium_carterae.1
MTKRKRIQEAAHENDDSEIYDSSNDEYKESFDTKEDPRCVRLTSRPPGATLEVNKYEWAALFNSFGEFFCFCAFGHVWL